MFQTQIAYLIALIAARSLGTEETDQSDATERESESDRQVEAAAIEQMPARRDIDDERTHQTRRGGRDPRLHKPIVSAPHPQGENKRTQDSVRALLTLAPQQAARRNADGRETVVDTAALAVGDVIVVRAGESVGADGVVVDGASKVDQASITGEPLPLVAGHEGGTVLAGRNGLRLLRTDAWHIAMKLR